MLDFDKEITSIQSSEESLSKSVNRLEGQMLLLDQQLLNNKNKISLNEESKIKTTKAIEVLQLVQRSTRDKIQEAFENTVTFALRFIYNEDYRFKLDFSQRGNIGELNFKLKSPNNIEYFDLENCIAGGSFDIISVALRFALIQIIRPKIEGMIVLDEATKQLSFHFRNNESKFYEAMSEKLGRQLIIITHSQQLIDLATNKITIGE